MCNAKRFLFSCFLLTSLCSEAILARPPYLTDDPVPVDYKHYEIFPYINSVNNNAVLSTLGPSVEINYGLLPNFEINITAGMMSNIAHKSNETGGLGISDVQLGIDYRFIQETNYIPQVAFNPAFFVPTGDSHRGLGNGRPYYSLPLWAQKSWEAWTLDVGGGYTINSAPEALNNYFGGILLRRDINSKWTLGGEIFYQGATTDTNPDTYLVNLGCNYNITNDFAFIFSAGHSIKGAVNFITLIGFDWTIFIFK